MKQRGMKLAGTVHFLDNMAKLQIVLFHIKTFVKTKQVVSFIESAPAGKKIDSE